MRRRELRLASGVGRLGSNLGLGGSSAYVLGPAFYINPTTGNDSNNGLTAGTAIASWGQLITASASFKAGVWAATGGILASLPTLAAGTQSRLDWYTAYLAGNRFVTGTRVIIDTSGGPLQVTAPLTLPVGCSIQSATGSLTNLKANVAVSGETWIVTSQADVWVSTKTIYAYSSFYEQVSGSMTPYAVVQAANATAAITALHAISTGGFWTDAGTGKAYIRTIAGGNPNTDGIAREYVPCFNGAGGCGLIVATGCLALNIGGDGGFCVDGTNSLPIAQYWLADFGVNDITVFDTFKVSRYGKHGVAAVGTTGMSGLIIRRNPQYALGPAINVANWSSDVDYTGDSTLGNGTAVTIFDGWSGTGNVSVVGSSTGTDTPPTFQQLIAHNDGDPGQQFLYRRLINCNFAGFVSLGSGETGTVDATNCTFGGSFASNVATAITISGCTINYRLPDLGPSGAFGQFTSTTFGPGTSFAGSNQIQGSWIFTSCTFNLDGGNGNSAQWNRQAAYAPTFIGCTITALANVKLFDSVSTASDVIVFNGGNIYSVAAGGVSKTNAVLVNSVNGGGSLTWATALANGSAAAVATGGCTKDGAPVSPGNPASLFSGIIHGIKAGTANACTTDAVDTTGKKLIALVIGSRGGVNLTITDTYSNTWVQRTAKTITANSSNSTKVCIYDCVNPTVGTGHQFTASGTNSLPTICYIAAAKSSGVVSFDQENGATGGSGTAQPGPITPAVAGSLLILGMQYDFQLSLTATVDSGYTISDQQDSAACFGAALAYMQAGNIAITNPTWTSTGQALAAVIACYK